MSYYTRITNDIERRLYEHNSGSNNDSYTHDKRPVELVFYEAFVDVNQAIAFEKKVEGWTRKKKEALIEINWDKLKELSTCLNVTSHMNFKIGPLFDSAQGDIRSETMFPTYRKYKNNKHFFKIVNESEFDEISFIGSKVIVVKHIAKILPDRNFIFDLLHDIGNTCEISTEEEYEKHLIK